MAKAGLQTMDPRTVHTDFSNSKAVVSDLNRLVVGSDNTKGLGLGQSEDRSLRVSLSISHKTQILTSWWKVCLAHSTSAYLWTFLLATLCHLAGETHVYEAQRGVTGSGRLIGPVCQADKMLQIANVIKEKCCDSRCRQLKLYVCLVNVRCLIRAGSLAN